MHFNYICFIGLMVFIVSCAEKYEQPASYANGDFSERPTDEFEIYSTNSPENPNNEAQSDTEYTVDALLLNEVARADWANDSPTSTDDYVSIFKNNSVFLNGLLNNDTDKNGDAIRIIQFTRPEFGVLELVAVNVIKYTPQENFTGIDLFSYTVGDGRGGKSTSQVIVYVQSVNNKVLARADSYSVYQGQSNIINVVENDTAPEKEVVIDIKVPPTNGKLEILEDNKIVFTPDDNYFGEDNFVYEIIDKNGDASVANVELNVECVSDCVQVFSLTWDASISLDIVGYKVYMGKYINQLNGIFDVADALKFDYTASTKGEYFFAVTAVNSKGDESELSTVVSVVF